MSFLYFAALAVTGFVAGFVGALLGIGGGVFVVPALVLGFHVPTLVAVGTSNVVVAATSTAGAPSYLTTRVANLRVGLALLTVTTAVALLSAFVASLLPGQVLSALFAAVLVYVGLTMLRSRSAGAETSPQAVDAVVPGQERSWDLRGAYYDRMAGSTERYSPARVRVGMAVSLVAGLVAGLLGVGGGMIQVPVMNMIMKMPLKASTATSNYMIGATAVGAAFVRYAHGDIDPLLAVPAAVFVFLGARTGVWLAPRIPASRLARIFGWVALLIACLMTLQALGIYNAGGK